MQRAPCLGICTGYSHDCIWGLWAQCCTSIYSLSVNGTRGTEAGLSLLWCLKAYIGCCIDLLEWTGWGLLESIHLIDLQDDFHVALGLGLPPGLFRKHSLSWRALLGPSGHASHLVECFDYFNSFTTLGVHLALPLPQTSAEVGETHSFMWSIQQKPPSICQTSPCLSFWDGW